MTATSPLVQSRSARALPTPPRGPDRPIVSPHARRVNYGGPRPHHDIRDIRDIGGVCWSTGGGAAAGGASPRGVGDKWATAPARVASRGSDDVSRDDAPSDAGRGRMSGESDVGRADSHPHRVGGVPGQVSITTRRPAWPPSSIAALLHRRPNPWGRPRRWRPWGRARPGRARQGRPGRGWRRRGWEAGGRQARRRRQLRRGE
jgi:hypothetical protein